MTYIFIVIWKLQWSLINAMVYGLTKKWIHGNHFLGICKCTHKMVSCPMGHTCMHFLGDPCNLHHTQCVSSNNHMLWALTNPLQTMWFLECEATFLPTIFLMCNLWTSCLVQWEVVMATYFGWVAFVCVQRSNKTLTQRTKKQLKKHVFAWTILLKG